MIRQFKDAARASVIGALLTVALVAAAPAARADYAVLRNGARLHVTGYARQGASIQLQVDGGIVVVPADQVARFEPEDRFQPVAPPTSPAPFGHIIRAAARTNGVDERLITSVIAAESNFHPRARSPKRAAGLMQLMPETARKYSVANAFDPAQNINGGTRYLKDLLGKYHQNLALALAAYNAGPGRVTQFHGVPPFPETRDYLHRVNQSLAKSQNSQPPGFRSMLCSPLRPSCEDTTENTPAK